MFNSVSQTPVYSENSKCIANYMAVINGPIQDRQKCGLYFSHVTSPVLKE